jgi:hypothetical protein
MPPKFIIAIASGTGGIAPSLMHLAQGFVKQNPDVPGLFYYFGVMIFFALGAVVALLFAETNAKKAFFLGIGLPALIATAQSQGTDKTVSLNLIPSAYAQQANTLSAPSVAASAPPLQQVKFRAANECKSCELWFEDASGIVISKHILDATANAKLINIPKGSKSVAVFDQKTNMLSIDLTKHTAPALTIEFDRKYNPWKDLRRGLGDYGLKSYDAVVELKPTAP